MAKRIETGWPTGCGLAVLLCAGVYQLACSFGSSEFLNAHVLVKDDAYYYFQVARNLALRGEITFDGIHATSGVQWLWTFVLAGLARLVPERVAFLRAVLVLSTALNVAGGLALRRLARRLHSAEVGDLAALFWAGSLFDLWPTMTGLEYPLEMLILIAAVSSFCGILLGALPTGGRLLRLGALLTLLFWARLDAALFSVVLWASTVAVMGRRLRSWPATFPQLAALSVVPVLGAVAYVATSYLLGGTLVPISGLVKAHYAARHFAAYGWATSIAGHLLWWVRTQCRPPLDMIGSVLLPGPALSPLSLAALAFAVAATAWGGRAIRARRLASPESYRMAMLIGSAWLIGALHAAVVVMTVGHFSHITRHYYGWQAMTWGLWAALLGHCALAGIGSPRRRRMASAAIVAAVVAVHGSVAIYRGLAVVPETLEAKRVRVAAWINENLPAGARIGAWNAGVLGYFSDRSVVNLDGLVNDRAYLRRLRSGASVERYLRAEGIHYVADVDSADLSMPYRSAWDHARWFRNSLRWEDMETLYKEERPGAQTLFVLRLRPR